MSNYDRHKKLKESEYKKELTKWYEDATKSKLDWNNLRTINEKIQWLKLYDSTKLKGLLADKYESREWLSNVLGEDYSVPIFGVWDSFDDIDFDKLPDKFVLKATHGSGWNIVVKDKNKLNKEEAKSKFDRWLSLDYSFISGFELHYKFIKPRIIAEEYLCDNIIDFRIFCFNGDPKEVYVDKYSGTHNHLRSIYDLSWNKRNVKCTWPDGGNINKPINFDLMILISKKLSSYFKFVRIDFYEINEKLYLGELTFTPMSGTGKYYPESYGIECGNWLNLRG